MGKTRPPERSKLARKHKRTRPTSPKELLQQASVALEQSETSTALSLASSALKILKNAIKSDEDALACLPALNLLGEICVELGDISAAHKYFTQAADLDADGEIPDSQGGGPDKFLWLAQLSEEGGQDAVQWFEKAAHVLRRQIASEGETTAENSGESVAEIKKRALASALCAISEIYMTDLSFLPEAELACSKAMDEALAVAPNDPETLQTMASVRISQDRRAEARTCLKKSLAQWEDMNPEDPNFPAFAVRVSLARLLMEAEMEVDAKEVVLSLIAEDDTSVEAWYLGGFCRYLLSKRANGSVDKIVSNYQNRARRWLRQCLKLYQQEDYEDERLKDHALELLQELESILGDGVLDESSNSDEWEDDDDDDDDSDDEDEDEDEDDDSNDSDEEMNDS
jgi:tetratricopeptide (TPR) repeat protein